MVRIKICKKKFLQNLVLRLSAKYDGWKSLKGHANHGNRPQHRLGKCFQIENPVICTNENHSNSLKLPSSEMESRDKSSNAVLALKERNSAFQLKTYVNETCDASYQFKQTQDVLFQNPLTTRPPFEHVPHQSPLLRPSTISNSDEKSLILSAYSEHQLPNGRRTSSCNSSFLDLLSEKMADRQLGDGGSKGQIQETRFLSPKKFSKYAPVRSSLHQSPLDRLEKILPSDNNTEIFSTNSEHQQESGGWLTSSWKSSTELLAPDKLAEGQLVAETCSPADRVQEMLDLSPKKSLQIVSSPMHQSPMNRSADEARKSKMQISNFFSPLAVKASDAADWCDENLSRSSPSHESGQMSRRPKRTCEDLQDEKPKRMRHHSRFYQTKSDVSPTDVALTGNARYTMNSKVDYPPSKVRGPVWVYWDIENCPVPRGASAVDVVGRIRDVYCSGRKEEEFIVAADVTRLSSRVSRELCWSSATLLHACSLDKNAADRQLWARLQAHLEGGLPLDRAVVLVSGDCDFADILYRLRYRCGVEVHVVCRRQSRAALRRAAHSSAEWEVLLEPLLPHSPDPEPARPLWRSKTVARRLNFRAHAHRRGTLAC